MSTQIEPWGFVVIEACDDYEQILALDIGKDKPEGGILVWADAKHPRVFFPTRTAARNAITRTHYYAKAFGLANLPEKADCRVEMIAAVKEQE
jgi:hypothetical protein